MEKQQIGSNFIKVIISNRTDNVNSYVAMPIIYTYIIAGESNRNLRFKQ